MAELADALDLGSSEEIRGGSTPLMPTKNKFKKPPIGGFFIKNGADAPFLF